jgi:predicted metal-dependent hydrolase
MREIWFKENTVTANTSFRSYIIHEGRKIEFSIVRKNVKNINLRVKHDSSVSVSCGYLVSEKNVIAFVKQKADWIIKSQKRYSINGASLVKYDHDEHFLFRGRMFVLKLILSSREKIIEKQDVIEIHVKDTADVERKKALMKSYARAEAKKLFLRSIEKMSLTAGLVFYPCLKIRMMRARWGSCHINKGCVVLNLLLVLVPEECIDYVVLHELLHFDNPSHNKEFYQTLDALMPGWKKHRQFLTELAPKIRERIF